VPSCATRIVPTGYRTSQPTIDHQTALPMKELSIMPRIAEGEYQDRLERLRSEVAKEGLDRFLVTSFDSIYYLTGAGFEPLERPFFLIVSPPGTDGPALLVPRLEAEHMRKAHGIGTIHTYWEYPSPKGRGWADVLAGLLGPARRIGVEPSLRGDV